MNIGDITTYLETIAPIHLQEHYDNAGLITGDTTWTCNGVLCCLDATETVVDEAIEKKCNLIIAHHPIIFSGLKKITGRNYVGRTIIKAIKNDIAIYAIHTNLDNTITGVNNMIAQKLGLQNIHILSGKANQLKKLFFYIPAEHADKVMNALFEAGGGAIGNYSECSFRIKGVGTFMPNDQAKPFIGEKGHRHESAELKIEMLFPAWLENKMLAALRANHPYEEVAYEIISLDNAHQQIGAGITGEPPEALDETSFLQYIKNAFGLKFLKHTALLNKKVKKVAACGGAGSFLIKDAILSGSDAYITSDIKYHDFFDADGKILLVDIGHYESEQFTIDLLQIVLKQKFPNFAVLKTSVNSNPVHYF